MQRAGNAAWSTSRMKKAVTAKYTVSAAPSRSSAAPREAGKGRGLGTSTGLLEQLCATARKTADGKVECNPCDAFSTKTEQLSSDARSSACSRRTQRAQRGYAFLTLPSQYGSSVPSTSHARWRHWWQAPRSGPKRSMYAPSCMFQSYAWLRQKEIDRVLMHVLNDAFDHRSAQLLSSTPPGALRRRPQPAS